MNKIKINAGLYIAMFLFAGVAVFLACRNSGQAFATIPVPLGFEGEYSQNQGPWQPLSEKNGLSSYDGDLVLRGRFDLELPEGAQLKFYLNHIGISIYVNGQNVFESSYEKYPEMCGRLWCEWEYWNVTEEDTLEIHLHNPTAMGTEMHTMNFWTPCIWVEVRC